MTAVAIKDGTELILDEHVYKVVGDPVGSEVWLYCQALNKRLQKTLQDIYRMIERGHARIRPTVKADKDHVIKKIEKRCSVKFANLNDKDREEALRRKAYVRTIIDTNCSALTKTRLDPLIGQTAERISDPKPPSWVTLYRWYTIYTKSGGDIRSLVSHASRRGRREKKLSRKVHDFIEEAIEEVYLTRYRASVGTTVAAVVKRINEFNRTAADQFTLPTPSEKTVRRAIKALDAYEVAVARYGRNAADRRFRAIGTGPKVSRPLERVEIDHTVLDLFIVDGETKRVYGRPTFTVMLDCYSRMVVGYYVGFEPPSVESVMHCLKQAIMPKDQLTKRYDSVQGDWPCFGVPETIVVDNGREFLSKDFEFACEQAGISIMNTPGRSPNFKGKVERFLRTMNTQCLTGLPGKVQTGKKIEGDFDPQKHAVLDIDKFEHHLMLWLIDVYSRQYHAGLKDHPIDVWNRGIKAYPHVNCPVSSEAFDFVFARRFKRSVSQKGIVFEHLKFSSEELIAWRARVYDGGNPEVEIRVNTSDLAVIQVVTPDGEVFDVPAEDMEYADGLRYQEHKIVCNYWNKLRSDSDQDVSLAAAKVRLWELAEKVKTGRRSVALSKKLARTEGVGSNAGATQKPKLVTTKVDATSIVELEGDWDLEDDDEDGAYVVVTGGGHA